MSLDLSAASLRSLLALAEKKEALLIEISKIDSEISNALETGSGAKSEIAEKPAKKAGRRKKVGGATSKAAKTGKRGRVKELILAGLKEAGEAGIAVKDLAVKLGLKPQNLHVWFHTTGKKSDLTERVSNGIYRLKQSVGAASPQEVPQAPEPKVTGKVRRKAKSLKKKS